MIYKHQSTLANGVKTAHPRMFATLLLTGILSLFSSLTILDMVVAAPFKVAETNGSLLLNNQTGNQTTPRLRSQRFRLNRLPANILNAIRQDLASKFSISQLTVVSYSRQNWTDGCLGLGTLTENCLATIVPGWRVVVSDGNQTWTYRTNSSGKTVRVENRTNVVNLPQSVGNAVLREASQYLNLPVSQLQIVEAQAKTWPNQCIGITRDPRLLCGPISQEGIPGWRVVVVGGEQRLVYRTNESASTVILDEATSNIGDAGTIKPSRIPASELPPPLPINVVFRAISSGGITGRTYQTTLLTNGQVIRELINNNGTSQEQQSNNISQSQLREFQSLLETQQFSQFNLLSYDPPRGAADFITVTFSSRSGTTRYADLGQARLPQRLIRVIQAWNEIANRV